MKWINGVVAYSVLVSAFLVIRAMLFPEIHIVPALVLVLLWMVARIQWKQRGGDVVLIASVVFSLLFLSKYVDDVKRTINALFVTLAERKHLYLDVLSVNETDSWLNGMILGQIALLVGSAIYYAIVNQKRWIVVTLALVIWSIQVLLGTSPSLMLDILFFAVLILTLLYMNHLSLRWWKRMAILPISLIVLMFAYTAINQNGNGEFTGSSKWEDTIRYQGEKFRYFKGGAPVLTGGNFHRLSTFTPDDHTALKVAMENPSPLYLKGFVGSTYTPVGWKEIEGDAYRKEKSLLEALEKEDFTGAKQLSLAAKSSLPEEYEEAKLVIQNVGASSRYIYAPYELAGIDTNIIRTKQADALHATGIFGRRIVEMNYMLTPYTDYPQIANALYATKDTDYLRRESHYNQYVYNEYLTVPQDSLNVLRNHLDESVLDSERRLPYEQTIQEVERFLAQSMSYNERAEPIHDQDFVTGILEESKEGYSVHYATIATLAFRMLGTPARYAEGYIVGMDDVKDLQSFSEINVSEKNAHAWTEIYVDMVGWVPIEVTPGYAEKMPEINKKDYPASGADSPDVTGGSTAEPEPNDTTEVQQDQDKPEDAKQVNPNTVLWFWLNMLIVVILFILIVLYVLRKRKRQNKLHVKDHRVAVVNHVQLMVQMLEKEQVVAKLPSFETIPDAVGGIDPQLRQDTEDSLKIYQKAKYSPHNVTNEERTEVEKLFARVYVAVKKSKKGLKKLRFILRHQ
ncbi:transglutaminase family protein [Sporosarcina ureae]|uniref:transglutaminase-like domain-containing protein n=1 Tax=Sporosarcina ureae TaxID=1571 RepID=UPI0026EE927E|nr:transglutaminase-like domain-containing protein [Sporosarcina ureae]